MENVHGGESMATSSSSLSTYQHTSGSGSCPLPFLIFEQEPPPAPGSWRDDDEARQRRQRIKGILDQFCGGAVGGEDSSAAALEMWFSDLGIAWVLRAAAGARLVLPQDQRDAAGRWTQALADVTESILDTYYSCFSHSHLESLPEEPEASSVPDPILFSRFIQETMLRMLSFVDAVVAPNNPDTSSSCCVEEILDGNGESAPPLEKLKTLLDVRGAVFMASFLIQPLLLSLSSSAEEETESCRAVEDMEALRSDKDDMLAQAIWSTMQEVTSAILQTDDSCEDTPQESSSAVHKITRSIERYIRLLEINYRSVDQIVRKAADCGNYVVPAESCSNTNPFTSMMAEMVSCLEEKLTKMSQSFPNKSLGLLFLINNLHSLWQKLHPMYDTTFNMPVLTRKIEDYIGKYVQEAWAPVLARLHTSPSPLQFGRRYFPVSKFESEFRKVHSEQKFWKVPDPELRSKLRKAISDEVASGLTNFLEENAVSTGGSAITPQEVEDMLQELFEG